MRLKSFLCILLIFFSLPFFTYAEEAPTVDLYMNGEKVICDVSPFIQNDRTLVPLRAIFELTGATLSWNDAKKEATVSGKSKIVLTIGSETAYVNNVKKTLDCAPVISNSRTMVPVRFISETLGLDVKWDATTYSVYISEKEKEKNTLKTLKISDDNDSLKVNLTFENKLTMHNSYILESPIRLVFEFTDCDAENLKTREIKLHNIKQLRLGNHEQYLKLVFDLTAESEYSYSLSADGKSAAITIKYANDEEDDSKPDEETPDTGEDENEDAVSPEEDEEVTAPVTPSDYVVVIDAGHGGSDSGTLARDENGEPFLYEKDINLKVANYCVEELKRRGIKVYATRTTDKTLQLSDRTTLANSVKADLFVSIHVNYFDNPLSNGTLTLYSKSKDALYPDDISSKEAAQIIQNCLYPALETTNAGIRSEDELYVLRKTEMPAVLIELGFISNEDDREMLTDDARLRAGASAIVDGIEKIIRKDTKNTEDDTND